MTLQKEKLLKMQAIEYFEKAIRLSPLDQLNFNNYVGMGSAHQVAGRDDEAAQCFIRALQERPNAYWIHRNLAAALHAAGRIEEAKASFDVLVKHHPDMNLAAFRNAMVFSPQALYRICSHLAALGVPEN